MLIDSWSLKDLDLKSKINLKISVAMPFSIILISSCASSALRFIPALENRTLRISKDKPGFEYQYEACIKEFLGVCVKKEMKKDVYDLTDPTIRQKLIDMGFVAKVREKL